MWTVWWWRRFSLKMVIHLNGTSYIWHTLSFISSIVRSPLSLQKDSFITPDLKDFFSILMLNLFQYLQTLSLTAGMIHYAHNSLQLLSNFLTIIFLLLGLRGVSQMMPSYDVHQGSSEPALGFRQSWVYIIVWLCCSSRTLSTWANNFTTCAVKLFAFVWKQRWSVSIIYTYVFQLFGTIACTCGYCSKQMQTISPHVGWNCLYVLMSPIYLVFSSWYLFNTRRKLQQHDRLCSILPP